MIVTTVGTAQGHIYDLGTAGKTPERVVSSKRGLLVKSAAMAYNVETADLVGDRATASLVH